MAEKRNLRLGTRRSLLAWAQSGWVAREIERLNPGVSVELIGIETRGDKILDVSLQNVAGKEFFVAELDEALRGGMVDLTVHSMKDLSLERPPELCLAAIPRRENPRDVVLFGPGVMEKLALGRKLRIGTSAPRRLENIPPFLRRALPVIAGREPDVDLAEIRGNVNTRLGRVHEPEGSPRFLDGVVLAFAGLIRLWNDSAGCEELERLLRGVRWMVLPLRECPAAPAQGALAVECRAADAPVRAMLGKLHDRATACHVGMERGLLAEWGGGCHQKFGATAVEGGGGLADLFHIRGVRPDGSFVDELRWERPPAPARGLGATWDGGSWRAEAEAQAADEESRDLLWEGLSVPECVFVAHSRAVRPEILPELQGKRIWTSGAASWQRLAGLGVWVEGCAEGLGFERLESTLREPALQLDLFRNWLILTHENASAGWQGAKVMASYRLRARYSERAKQALRAARIVFWSSGSQWDELKEWAPQSAIHACGPGKTAARLRDKGVEPLVFPSIEEWRKWIRQSSP